jgi:branched-subunit amino acid ABC-type transport system permease component
MSLALAWLSLALDGESVNNGNTGLAIVSVVSIAVGWVALAALWYFVFRDKTRAGRRKRPRD